jgi:hypothetical protein
MLWATKVCCRIEAENVTEEDQRKALERKRVFQEWFLTSFLSANNSHVLDTIVVTPLSEADPEYRDDYTEYVIKAGLYFWLTILNSAKWPLERRLRRSSKLCVFPVRLSRGHGSKLVLRHSHFC